MIFILKKTKGQNWIINSKDELIYKIRKNIDIKYKNCNHKQYLSKFTLGNIITIINEKKLHFLFDFDTDLKSFYDGNRNYGIKNYNKIKLTRIDKNNIILNLLRTLRNKSFHWENLYKVRIKNNKTIPILSHKFEKLQTLTNISSDKINDFLIFIIKAIYMNNSNSFSLLLM